MPSKSAKRPPVRLQDKDFILLRGLFESRLMSSRHIAALYFNDSKDPEEAARKRLYKLKYDGYVGERPRRVYEAARLFLTKKSFIELQKKGQLHGYPSFSWKSFEKRPRVSEVTERHEIKIMDVKAAIVLAVNALPDFKVTQFSTWPVLYQFKARTFTGYKGNFFKPDGFICVEEKNDPVPPHYFFLEVDLSNMVQRKLGNKALCYGDYYFSGNFAISQGGRREAKEDFPFLFLVVVENTERRNYTAEQLLENNPQTLTQAWLTTYDEVTKTPLGSIWITPKDYQDITKDTIYDLARRERPLKPHSPREAFVEQSIKKHRLFE
jgi:hypothetical protein